MAKVALANSLPFDPLPPIWGFLYTPSCPTFLSFIFLLREEIQLALHFQRSVFEQNKEVNKDTDLDKNLVFRPWVT
jgi:hypothetical protein